jgi:hypothetical protein
MEKAVATHNRDQPASRIPTAITVTPIEPVIPAISLNIAPKIDVFAIRE